MIHISIVKSGNGVISIFNSASQGQQSDYVVGGILYHSDSIILISSKIKAFIGTSSNICDEIKALIFLLTVAVEERWLNSRSLGIPWLSIGWMEV